MKSKQQKERKLEKTEHQEIQTQSEGNEIGAITDTGAQQIPILVRVYKLEEKKYTANNKGIAK